jgi:hypothetical protein
MTNVQVEAADMAVEDMDAVGEADVTVVVVSIR